MTTGTVVLLYAILAVAVWLLRQARRKREPRLCVWSIALALGVAAYVGSEML